MYNFGQIKSGYSAKAKIIQYNLAFFIIASMAFLALSQAAFAQNKQNAIPYTIRSGDTLLEIKNKYIRSEISHRLIQKFNGIENAKHLKIGSTLFLPRQYLRFERSGAEILSLRGDILIANQTGAEAKRLKVGDVIREGAVINTGRSSFMSLALEDGSQISLPSNSNVTLKRMRRYVIERAIDYDFDILSGGSRTKVAPLRGDNDRFRIRTPKAVSAVRGTEFQMRVDADTNNAIAEVVEGSLAVSNNITNSEAPLPAGNGLAVTKTGGEIREKLLPAPVLVNGSDIQKNEQVNFQIAPVAGAKKYRISLANDASFLEQFEDKISDTSDITLPSLDNGRYFVRASALSENGIEGLYSTYSFKRLQNTVSAKGAKQDDGFLFKWAGSGNAQKNFHFQFFNSNGENRPSSDIAVIDESGLMENNILLSNITQGEYVWRLGTTIFDDGEVHTNWSEYQTLTVGSE